MSTPDSTASGGRDLGPLLRPRSVAVVGASETPGKWGHRIATSALLGAARRSIALVNRGRTSVLGHPAYRSVREVEPAPELVVVTVPPSAVVGSVEDALGVGAAAVVVITDHIEGDVAALVDAVRTAGAVLVGPNCAGLANPHAELSLAIGGFPPGDVAIVAQSGAMGLDIASALAGRRLGLAALLTVGEQADLTVADALAALADEREVNTVLCYVEDFRDGRAFVSAASRAAERDVRVGVLAAGRSEQGARAAQSHTGALVTARDVVAAACRAGGAVLVDDPAELADYALACTAGPVRGRRFIVVGDGGGHCSVAADELVLAGAELPALSDDESTRGRVPGADAWLNPIDLGAAVDLVDDAYSAALDAALGTGCYDAALVVGGFGALQDPLEQARECEEAQRLAAVARTHRTPVVVQTFADATPAVRGLVDAGLPVFRDLGSAARSAARLVVHERSAAVHAPSRPAPRAEPGYWGARSIAAAAGVPMATAVRCASPIDAIDAAREVGYPVVLKAVGALHKSDSAGVRCGLTSDAELQAACVELVQRLHPTSLSVEACLPVDLGVELLIGGHRDRRFGPVVLVGAGGVLVEAFADTATLLAPCTVDEVLTALARLRVSTLLAGHRGKPPVDVRGVAQIATTVGALLVGTPWLQSFELNPVLALPDRSIALDARHAIAPRLDPGGP